MNPGDERRSAAQMPLPLRLDKHALFATFVAGANASALAHVAAVAGRQRRDIVWLCGPAGSGKTHLLQAACRAAHEQNAASMYISLCDEHVHAEQLLGAEQLGLVALDDVDAVAGDAEWEARLFTVFNEFQSRGSLLLAARNPPSAVPFDLGDLASRAAGAIVYRLQELDEAQQLDALLGHAGRRGLELDAATARFLQSRVQRGMTELCEWLDRLDRASLAAQRRLTIPFVREVLARR
ncbi:MAG TPA: DnaA regulatory inactivator Hda [Gammaproteobacteria bacterium]|jgi:DnaA family protein